MPTQTENEKQLAELIVESLNLVDVSAQDIDPDGQLFGEGLGLDSIDALELALAITQKYDIQIKANDKSMQEAFGTLRSLNAYVMENTAKTI